MTDNNDLEFASNSAERIAVARKRHGSIQLTDGREVVLLGDAYLGDTDPFDDEDVYWIAHGCLATEDPDDGATVYVAWEDPDFNPSAEDAAVDWEAPDSVYHRELGQLVSLVGGPKPDQAPAATGSTTMPLAELLADRDVFIRTEALPNPHDLPPTGHANVMRPYHILWLCAAVEVMYLRAKTLVPCAESLRYVDDLCALLIIGA